MFFYRSRSVNLQIEIFRWGGRSVNFAQKYQICSKNIDKSLYEHKNTEMFRLRRASRSTKQKYNSKSGFKKNIDPEKNVKKNTDRDVGSVGTSDEDPDDLGIRISIVIVP